MAWLDSLKGFAIICVVLGHVVNGFLSADAFIDFRSAQASIFQATYAFHMPLFSLISGFMYSLAYFDSEGKPKWAKLKWQLLNIAIVYVIFSALLISSRMFLAAQVVGDTSWYDLLYIPLRPFKLYWYLYVLFVFYLLFIPVYRCRNTVLLLLLFLALSLFAAQLQGFVPSFFSPTPFRVLFFAFFFFCGVLLSRTGMVVSWTVAIISAVVSILLLVFFWGDATGWPSSCISYKQFVNTFVAIAICLFLWKLFSSVRVLNTSVFNLCGRYCLEIYVIHTFLATGFRSILPALGLTNFWLNVVLNTVLSTALPLLFAIVLQRIGLHDILFRPAYFIKSRIEARAKP
ncbi:MAG: acyltransferase [Bacteroidales bacterium]|nr:acyltransferase [Bacteroidales bacterium]